VYSPYDSLFSQQKHILKHTVRSGESLSIVAKRYGVSTSKLKSYNNLKSIHLKIGQKLNIPANYSLSVSKDQKQVVQNTQIKTIYQAPLAHAGIFIF
jgi:N-acetylmuramoyl-L-alanine amidase